MTIKKRAFKILLVDPPHSPYAWQGSVAPPLGILYIASAIQNNTFGQTNHHQVNVLPLHLYQSDFEVEFDKTVKRFQPDIIGYSAITPSFNIMVNLSINAKKISPKIINIFGGYQSSKESKMLLNKNHADYVVLGEGERTFCELLIQLERKNTKALSGITGIAYKENNEIVNTGLPVRIKNLDILPFPARELVPMEEYKKLSQWRAGGIVTSRGCFSKCNFCYSPVFWSQKIIYRSIENVIAEIRHLKNKYNIRKIKLEDDLFTLNRGRILEFCDKIKQFNLNPSWLIRSCPEHLDEPILRVMKEVGLERVQIGFESISSSTLTAIGKSRNNRLQYERIIDIMHKLDICIIATVIIGLPNESPGQMLETVHFMNENLTEKDIFICSVFTPFPGIICHKENNFIIESEDLSHYTMNTPVTSSNLCSLEELIEVKKFAYEIMKKIGPPETKNKKEPCCPTNFNKPKD